jgi:mevalonate kinase
MTETTATAPGKIILAGEHAVVYGRPAIAIPVWQARAQARITDLPPGLGCHVSAPQIDLNASLAHLPPDDAIALVTRLALQHLSLLQSPDWEIQLHSSIPIASGLGSGAAISAALVRAIFKHSGLAIDAAEVSRIVFESERLYHGTPSGIDNTVIAYGKPVWFVKGRPPEHFLPGGPFTIVIADSGIRAPTKETVGDVRTAWNADRDTYEAHFDAIAAVVTDARSAIEAGDPAGLGRLFNENQALLARLGVSSPALEHLIDVANRTGAWGAKLSGGGIGGNIIALIEPGQAEIMVNALLAAGASNVIVTQLRSTDR